MENSEYLLISYWPLLRPESVGVGPGDIIQSGQFNPNMIPEPPTIYGILWAATYDDEAPVVGQSVPSNMQPIFIIDNAEKVYDHIIYWMDGDFSRFVLSVKDDGESYAIALIPNVSKSIKRYQLNRMITHEEIVDSKKFKVLYYALGTKCPISNLSRAGLEFVKSWEVTSINVGFIDVTKLNMNDPKNLGVNSDDVMTIGPFVVAGSDCDQYVSASIDHMFKS